VPDVITSSISWPSLAKLADKMLGAILYVLLMAIIPNPSSKLMAKALF
jgi:hypothetical protein